MTKDKLLWIGGGVIIAAVILGIVLIIADSGERATITVNDRDLEVRLADTVLERQQGLSGYELSNLDAEGMLFVFQDHKVRNFWMKGMNFALDVIWIKDDKIVSVDYDVQPPDGDEEPEKMTSNPIEVDKVLEVPAGKAESLGLTPGILVKIDLP